jgi:hypothetical protein
MNRTFSEYFFGNKNRQPILTSAFNTAAEKLGIEASITDQYGTVDFHTAEAFSRREEFYQEVSVQLNGTPLEGVTIAPSTQFVDFDYMNQA